MVAAREVGPADGSLEQHVADDCQLRFWVVEDDVAGRVSGAMADAEGQLADRHRVAVDQPAVGLERFAGNAIGAAVVFEPGDPETVVFMRPLDRHPEFFRKDAGRAAMVDVAVGEQDFLDGDAVLGDGRAQLRQIAARIDEGTEHRPGAPDKAAVLLQRRHRYNRRAKRGLGHRRRVTGKASACPSPVGRNASRRRSPPRRAAPAAHCRRRASPNRRRSSRDG